MGHCHSTMIRSRGIELTVQMKPDACGEWVFAAECGTWSGIRGVRWALHDSGYWRHEQDLASFGLW